MLFLSSLFVTVIVYCVEEDPNQHSELIIHWLFVSFQWENVFKYSALCVCQHVYL